MLYIPLISNNLSIFSVNSDGLSLLDVAVLNNNRQLAKMLVTFGAQEGNQCAYCVFLFDKYVLWSHNGSFIIIIIVVVVVVVIIIIIIIIYLSWSWATCWPVPVSRIQKSLQRSTMIPSASWGVVFHYPA